MPDSDDQRCAQHLPLSCILQFSFLNGMHKRCLYLDAGINQQGGARRRKSQAERAGAKRHAFFQRNR